MVATKLSTNVPLFMNLRLLSPPAEPHDSKRNARPETPAALTALSELANRMLSLTLTELMDLLRCRVARLTDGFVDLPLVGALTAISPDETRIWGQLDGLAFMPDVS